MAADDAAERTEHPTARRLEEAYEAGRIPRSGDLTAALALLGGLLLLKQLGAGMLESLLKLAEDIGSDPDVRADGLYPRIIQLVLAVARLLLPFLVLLMVFTAVGTVLQSGLRLSFKRLTPKLDQLNPVNGVRRLFSFDSVTRLGMGALKMLLVTAVAYSAIAANIQSVLSAGTLDPPGALHLGAILVYKMALRMGVALLILALFDYAYQRWTWWRNLKMTKQEVKDELKNMEGDPLIRQRRRQAQLRLALQRLHIDVPRSDVVVTNPTEYAVALQYDEAAMAAPRVTAKGKDFLALRIRQIAQQHGIPLVQRPPLARALYAAVEVGQEIPSAFYRAVAELLAYVYRLTGRVPVQS